MARQQTDWNALIRSIRLNRAGNATFYKPVCVIAAIDLADIGRLEGDLLHSELIVRRFSEYVSLTFPDRSTAGWQPLWFLANDGLWTFSKKGKQLSREALEARPSTKNKAFEKFDTHAIAAEYRDLWDSAAQRKALRDNMLSILARDPESRTLVRALFDISNLANPELWPSERAIDEYLQDVADQGDLFQARHSNNAASPVNVELKDAHKALLAFKLDSLPATSAVGPKFEATGEAPIKLSHLPIQEFSRAQRELHQALADKCRNLESLASLSNNRAAHIMPALRLLISALDVGLSDSSSYLIWSHGNTLRQLHDAEIVALNAEDPEAPPLPDRLRVLLSDIVEQFNAYAVTDHIIGLLDRARSGPGIRTKSLQLLETGTELVRAIKATPEVVEPDATEILDAATNAAEGAKQKNGFNADQAIVNAVEIQRNGARAILVNAVLEIRKISAKLKSPGKMAFESVAKQLGAEVAKQLPLSKFVSAARELFVALWEGVTGSDAVHQLIQHLRDFINQLRL